MTEDIKNGFVRQRRNLVLICLILLFVEVADVEFNRLNLLGNELVINNSNVVTYALWVGFAYWLIRYLQYFNGLPDKGILKEWYAKLDKMLPLVAIEKYKQETDLKQFFPEIDVIPKISLAAVEIQTRENDYWDMAISIDVYANDRKGHVGHTTQGIGGHRLDKEDMKASKLKAWISIVFLTHLFTEYFLPFALAGLTVLANLWIVVCSSTYA